jgi:hypothetical protein
MSGDGGRMANPGWRGRVEDIRFGAAERVVAAAAAVRAPLPSEAGPPATT